MNIEAPIAPTPIAQRPAAWRRVSLRGHQQWHHRWQLPCSYHAKGNFALVDVVGEMPQDDICSRLLLFVTESAGHMFFYVILTLSTFILKVLNWETTFPLCCLWRLKFHITWNEPLLSYEVVSFHSTFQCHPSAPYSESKMLATDSLVASPSCTGHLDSDPVHVQHVQCTLCIQCM